MVVITEEAKKLDILSLPIWEYKEMGPDGVISSSYINQKYKQSDRVLFEEIIKQLSYRSTSMLRFHIHKDDARALLDEYDDKDYWNEDKLLIQKFKPLTKVLPMASITMEREHYYAFTHLWLVCITLKRK